MTFKSFINKLRAAIKEYPSKANLKPIAESTKNEVRKRTISGQGVKESGKPASELPGLQDSTIERRRYLKKKGKLAPGAIPSKSQVYRTGKMLDNTKAQVKSKGFTIQPTASKQKVKAEKLDERKFKWLNLSDKEVDTLTKELDKALQKELDSKLS